MCRRGITPSSNSLFAQKFESHITHVFVYSLHEIAFEKFSLQSKVYRIGSYFANSASCENGISFNFLEIPTHLRFSLNYFWMHVVNNDGSFRQILAELTVLTPASYPTGKTPSYYY